MKCIEKNNDRFFGGQKLTAEFYDGYSDFHVNESKEERNVRIKKWEEELENQSSGDEAKERKKEKETGVNEQLGLLRETTKAKEQDNRQE
jgi:hypothetical protein